jgi:DNA-binding transcriptional regulator/RsmH inhibitor MraZ
MVDAKGRLAVPFKLRGTLGRPRAIAAPPPKAEAPAKATP